MNTGALRITSRARGTAQDLIVRAGNVVNRFLGLSRERAQEIRRAAERQLIRMRRSAATGRPANRVSAQEFLRRLG